MDSATWIGDTLDLVPPSRAPSPAPSNIPISRHPEYYIQDNTTVFLVERSLFKVHRYFLERESEVFRGMFLSPPPQEGAEGQTDSNPISLPGVTKFEFESLLNFLYKGMHDDFRFSSDRWIALLSISSRYDMDKIRQRAIRELTSLSVDPVDKIVLAVKHNIPDWLAPAYVSLCLRPTTLEENEARRLGWSVTIKLFRAREEVRAFQSGSSAFAPHGQFGQIAGSYHGNRYGDEVSQIINEVFWPSVDSNQ